MGFPRLFWCRTLSEPVCADHRSRMLFVDERSLRPPGHHRSRAAHIFRRVPAPVRDVASANQRERAWFWARELLILPGLHCPRSPFFQSCMWRYSWSYIMCWPYSPYNTLLYTCRKSPRSVTRGGEGRGGRHARACHVHFPLSGLHGMAFDVWKLKMYLNKRLMRTALKSHAAQLRPVQATASCVARR